MPTDSQSLPSESTSPASSFFSQIPISQNRTSNATRSIVNSPEIPKLKKLNPTWRKGHFSQNPEFIKFIGETSMPDEIKKMTSPKDFFCYFFDDELLSHIAEQSTLYSAQQNPEKPYKMTKNDTKFFGYN